MAKDRCRRGQGCVGQSRCLDPAAPGRRNRVCTGMVSRNFNVSRSVWHDWPARRASLHPGAPSLALQLSVSNVGVSPLPDLRTMRRQHRRWSRRLSRRLSTLIFAGRKHNVSRQELLRTTLEHPTVHVHFTPSLRTKGQGTPEAIRFFGPWLQRFPRPAALGEGLTT